MKKAKLLLVCFTVLLSLAFSVSADNGGLHNFTQSNQYTEGQFTDVPTIEWFASNVATAYKLGLMKGTTTTTFNPKGNVSVAESIVLACRLHSIYHTGAAQFEQGNPWYQVYVDYAVSNNIIKANEYTNYTASATRAQFASILASALPDNALKQINNIQSGNIPDVPASANYAKSVYRLYNAGILTGNSEKGEFTPDSNIQRSAVAAIVTRMADESLRRTFTLTGTVSVPSNSGKLSSQEISQKCSSAVFYVETYSFNGAPSGSGSGFFISSDGIAVTNNHVISNSSYIKIVTTDNKVYDKIKIIDTDETNDLALLKVEGNGFNYLNTGDSSKIAQGQQVYAIGSPEGFANTMSQGIISNTSRIVDNAEYFQISVPITHGSSGGALIDEYGDVIGVTTRRLSTESDLNLAMPINKIHDLEQNTENDYYIWDDIFYPGFKTVLDFGEFSGVKLLSVDTTPTGYTIEYDGTDFYPAGNYDAADCFANTIAWYCDALQYYGMTFHKSGDATFTLETETERVVISANIQFTGKIVIKVSKILKFYNRYYHLPDFGWYSELPLTESYYKNGSDVFVYNWADYYQWEDFEEILFLYFNLLENNNFYFIKEEKDKAYLFKGHELSIVLIVTDEQLYVDIAPLNPFR